MRRTIKIEGMAALEIDTAWYAERLFHDKWSDNSYLLKTFARPQRAARKYICMLDVFGRIDRQPETVLDLFTGVGVCLRAVGRLWPGAEVRARDIDPVSGKIVQRNFNGVSFRCCDSINGREPGADLVLGDFYQFTVLDVLRESEKARCVQSYLRQGCGYFVLTDSAIYRLHLNAGWYSSAFSRSVRSPGDYYRLLSDVLGRPEGYTIRHVAYTHEASYVLLQLGYRGELTTTRWR